MDCPDIVLVLVLLLETSTLTLGVVASGEAGIPFHRVFIERVAGISSSVCGAVPNSPVSSSCLCGKTEEKKEYPRVFNKVLK